MPKGAWGDTGTCIHLRRFQKANSGTHCDQTVDSDKAAVGVV